MGTEGEGGEEKGGVREERMWKGTRRVGRPESTGNLRLLRVVRE